ncbi:MAG: hypothetical protein LBR68_06725, partial [Lachnoclostridium sp.]|nr:hypothetical protein [Lachnoclostridium sp.]
MTGLEVLLIVLGFIFIGLSFFLSNKNEKGSDNVQTSQLTGAELWSEKDEILVKERIMAITNEQSEDVLEETKDRLNQISNEKIMTVDDFSNQLLEKIENNHKEVIFMYNMLNEKEKELKDLVAGNPVNVMPPKQDAQREKPDGKTDSSKKTRANQKSSTENRLAAQGKPTKGSVASPKGDVI